MTSKQGGAMLPRGKVRFRLKVGQGVKGDNRVFFLKFAQNFSFSQDNLISFFQLHIVTT